MLIWCHRIISGLVHFLIFLAAIFGTALLYQRSGLFYAWSPGTGAVMLIIMVLGVMYFLGLPVAAAIEQCLPVRCPQCRQAAMRARRRGWYEVLCYRCRACGHQLGGIEGPARDMHVIVR
jgi:hypothetical protein